MRSWSISAVGVGLALPSRKLTVDEGNPAPVHLENLRTIIYRALYISSGAGFLPSTLANGNTMDNVP